ncbi:hypothetical protein BY996DRAFT_4574313, partial [Phakopsora pachyrhizi]
RKQCQGSVTFCQQNIFWLSQKPKYPQTSVPHAPKMHVYWTLVQPLNIESAMKKIKDNNPLLLIVDTKVNKKQIAEAVKKLYDVTLLCVSTLIQPNGKINPLCL